MKSILAGIAIALLLPTITFSEGKVNALDDQLLEGIEDLKREYRAGLANLLKDTTRIVLYNLDLEEKRESNRIPFAHPEEGYFEFGQFEYKIKKETEISGDNLDLWKSALDSLLIPKGPGAWVASHSPNTALIVYGKGMHSALGESESRIFELTFSWSNNNYYIDYRHLGWDRHPIVGMELKELIMKEFPNESYEVNTQVTEMLNQHNQTGDDNSE